MALPNTGSDDGGSDSAPYEQISFRIFRNVTKTLYRPMEERAVGPVVLLVLSDFPLIRPHDDLAAIVIATMGASRISPIDGDVLVLAQKVVSKAEGHYLDLAEVRPSQRATVEDVRGELQGKILIDATVPLVPPKVARVQLPPEGSAVASIQKLLGESVRVVSAFQNVSAHHLKDFDHDIECDRLVCADDVAARDAVIKLANDIGLRAFHAGPIGNSVVAEALTSILIAINTRYKVPGAGIRITGVPHTRDI